MLEQTIFGKAAFDPENSFLAETIALFVWTARGPVRDAAGTAIVVPRTTQLTGWCAPLWVCAPTIPIGQWHAYAGPPIGWIIAAVRIGLAQLKSGTTSPQ